MKHKDGDELRLQYSGFIVFLSRLISVGTGLLFVLMVTRSITKEEFGIYGNTSDVLSYFTLASTVIPFWTTRFIARKHSDVSKTGFIANIIFSAIFALLYILLISAITSVLQVSEAYKVVYIILVFQIVENFTIAELEAILQARQPQMIGFGFLISEVCKVIVGFLLIVELGLGLLGAVSSITIAYVVQTVFYLKLTLSCFNEKIRWAYVKEWLRASPVNFYTVIGQRFASFFLILLFVQGGELARAYYGAASTIASVIGFSSLLAFALYPRLLSRSDPKDVLTSLRSVFMFMMPMTVGAIILSDSYLVILNPVYLAAKPVLILLSVTSACLSLSSVFGTIVTGREEIDVQGTISLRKLARTRLFLFFSLPYVELALTIPSAYFVLTTVVKGGVEASVAIAAISLIANIVTLSIRFILARRCMKFSMPWSSISRFAVASTVMAVVLYVLPSPSRLSATLVSTLLGGVAYLAVLSAIDKDTRTIIRATQRTFAKLLRAGRHGNSPNT